MKTQHRTQYDAAFKREKAEAYLAGMLTAAEMKRQKLHPGNVHRWARALKTERGKASSPPQNGHGGEHKMNGMNGAPPHAMNGKANGEHASDHGASPSTIGGGGAMVVLSTKVERGANGRYAEEVRTAFLAARAAGVPLNTIQARTGIHQSSLYSWEKARVASGGATTKAPKRTDVVPAEKREPKDVAIIEGRDELLVELDAKEGFTNLVKAKKKLLARFRAGQLADFDEFHLRAMLAIKLIVGD